MPPPQKEQLRRLTPQERTTLARISQASSERVDRVRRATALLALADGQSLAQAARQAGFRSGSAGTALLQRFNQGGLAALDIAAGRGRKVTYGPAARAQIIATAQRPPDRKTDGTGRRRLECLVGEEPSDGRHHRGHGRIRVPGRASDTLVLLVWCLPAWPHLYWGIQGSRMQALPQA